MKAIAFDKCPIGCCPKTEDFPEHCEDAVEQGEFQFIPGPSCPLLDVPEPKSLPAFGEYVNADIKVLDREECISFVAKLRGMK